jgi:antitoxin (DNA-binding transcriptional repressor) of toxin-antitoxin stability system
LAFTRTEKPVARITAARHARTQKRLPASAATTALDRPAVNDERHRLAPGRLHRGLVAAGMNKEA